MSLKRWRAWCVRLRGDEMLKRVVDLVLAVIGLTILLPLFALVAAATKIDSRGPVFFKQKRIGRHGKVFEIFKFRTMVNGAYKMGSRLTVKRDPRITRVGQILRWFKIDELPQLINVLRGEMSMIGPRPEDPYFVGFYTEGRRRFSRFLRDRRPTRSRAATNR
jgi:lipopolysaccharide/colanic/teichoic acid biosynthesis glycosyltransferase